MCGICGIYHLRGRPIDRGLLQSMNNTLLHRGPDGEGYFLNGNVGLGHRRLSIIDLEAGKQPMSNEDGSVQVVFNGEIYNFLELREFLKKKGHCFSTRSDTEVIVHGYEEWGETVFEHLRGMFAIALWDAARQKILLARDRLGKKPLYYFLDKDRLAFASELKALISDPAVPRELDLEALDCYLTFGYVPSPLSIFKSVRKLSPAHLAVCDRHGFSVRPYWHLDMEHEAPPRTESEIIDELKSLFDESVGLRMISDVPLGAFLSGGVDSGAVVASMATLVKDAPVKTTTIGFNEQKYDELDYARVVANLYHTDHAEFVVTPDALQVIEKIVWHLDEPFADASAIPTYYVSQMARQKVTVALSGDGGDETFAGYIQRYLMNRTENRIRSRLPRFFRSHVLCHLADAYPRLDTFPRPLRLKSFLTNLSTSAEEAYFRDMSFYFLPEMKGNLYRPEMSEELKDHDVYEHLRRHFAKNHNPDITTRVQYVDIKSYLPEDILVKVDRMSMAHSLEVRSPILDHKLIELAGKLPSRLKLNGKESKYILKKAMRDRLPEDILYRKKQGFCVPLAQWLRGELREFTNEKLFSSSSKSRVYFNEAYMRQLWDAHLSGRQDNSAPLWGLLMFELWQQQFIQ